MATITCGWCRARCHMTLFGEVRFSKSRDPFVGHFADAMFICDGCGRPSLATWTFPHDELIEWDPIINGSYDEDSDDSSWPVSWYPTRGHQMTFPDVPSKIAETACEAWTCHAAGAHRGAVMLARAVVESTAKEKGIKNGTLNIKIDELADQGLIRKVVAEQAHEIRHLGNSTAHGDLDDAVTPEDSEEVLNLMAEVLNEVWQAPARSRRLAKARKAKKAQRQSEASTSHDNSQP